MLYIIMAISIVFIFLVRAKYDKNRKCFVCCDIYEYHLSEAILASIMLGLGPGLLAWFFIGGVAGIFLPKTEIVTEQELTAFPDSQYIQYDDNNISYMIESDGAYRVERVSINDTKIHYQNQKPVVATHEYEFKENWWGTWIADNSVPRMNDYTEIYLPAEE